MISQLHKIMTYGLNMRNTYVLTTLPVEEIEVNGISNDNHFALKVFYTMVGMYIHVCERIKYVIFILISNITYRVCSYHVNYVIR